MWTRLSGTNWLGKAAAMSCLELSCCTCYLSGPVPSTACTMLQTSPLVSCQIGGMCQACSLHPHGVVISLIEACSGLAIHWCYGSPFVPSPMRASGTSEVFHSECQVISKGNSNLLQFDLKRNACFDCKPAKALMSAVIAHAAYTAASNLLSNV